jgi:hypothetical protein
MIRFDKGLRGRALKPNPSGYSAPPTDDVNAEDPCLQLGGIKDGGVWLTDQDLPAIIDLSVRLNAIRVDSIPSALVQLGDHAPVPLYARHSAFAALQVVYAGTGRYQKQSGDEGIAFIGNRLSGDTLELPAPCLYQKDFPHQRPGQHIRWMPQHGGQGGILPLWAYGGRKVGEDVQPFVFTVEGLRQETSLIPRSLLYWREQGITPPEGGWTGQEEAVFQDAFSHDQTLSFQESIEAGKATLQLKVGSNERGEAVTVPYQSFRFSKNWLSYQRGA